MFNYLLKGSKQSESEQGGHQQIPGFTHALLFDLSMAVIQSDRHAGSWNASLDHLVLESIMGAGSMLVTC